MRALRALVVLSLLTMLAACAGAPRAKAPVLSPGAMQSSPGFKVGKPYQVNGEWYYPSADWDYDETGIASWYGPRFHGKKTANGEIFNQDEMTAAHKTLPLPSLVRVTNLENGRSIVARVNDRGPYSRGRIIDLSRRSAQLLGFIDQGTAKVRVTMLADETMKFVADSGVTIPAEHLPKGKTSPKPAAKPAGRPVTIAAADGELIPGREVKGRFLPDAKVDTTPISDARIFVQAGSFTNYDNALRLRQRLQALGPTAITPAVVRGQQFYRVRLGPLASVDEGDRMLDQVADLGQSDATLIVD